VLCAGDKQSLRVQTDILCAGVCTFCLFGWLNLNRLADKLNGKMEAYAFTGCRLMRFRTETKALRLGAHRMAIAVRKLVPDGVKVTYSDDGVGLNFKVSARDGTQIAFFVSINREAPVVWNAYPVESDGWTRIPDSYGGTAEARFQDPSAADMVAFCAAHGMG
jgi:hypothetical protein